MIVGVRRVLGAIVITIKHNVICVSPNRNGAVIAVIKKGEVLA